MRLRNKRTEIVATSAKQASGGRMSALAPQWPDWNASSFGSLFNVGSGGAPNQVGTLCWASSVCGAKREAQLSSTRFPSSTFLSLTLSLTKSTYLRTNTHYVTISLICLTHFYCCYYRELNQPACLPLKVASFFGQLVNAVRVNSCLCSY